MKITNQSINLNKYLIGKAVFGLVIVAAVATAGVSGFARAATVQPAATTDGYGGTAGQVQAAVAAFNAALTAATDKFSTDVDACVAGLTGTTAAANTLNATTDAAAANLSALAANPTSAATANAFASQVQAGDTTMQAKVDSATTALVASLDTPPAAASRRATFRQCMQSARSDLRTSIRDARTTFRNAIHSIFS